MGADWFTIETNNYSVAHEAVDPSKENQHFYNQSKQVVFFFSSGV